MEDNPGVIWEPWTPVPGTPVTIRISGECPQPHQEWEHRRTGTVTEIPDATHLCREIKQLATEKHPTMRGHYYQVEYDKTAPTGSRGAMYAAIELEPIEQCVDGTR